MLLAEPNHKPVWLTELQEMNSFYSKLATVFYACTFFIQREGQKIMHFLSQTVVHSKFDDGG